MTSDPETRINLAALKRRDPYISNILDTATQVAVYTFNQTTGEWEKTEVEGTLFVYSRLARPLAGFTIMNRLGIKTLTEPLGKELDFQNQNPFLLYKNAKMMIYGIWFYDMHDCHRIGSLLVDLSQNGGVLPKTKTIAASSDQHHRSPTSSTSSGCAELENIADDPINMNSNEETGLVMGISSEKPSNGAKQSVSIIDMLSRAKINYDKVHRKNDQETDASIVKKKKTPAELPKPVTANSNPKKVNVALLFGQSDVKKSIEGNRPSSADVFRGKDSENEHTSANPASKTQPRYSNRSLSLSLTNEQLRSQVPNLLNGAISVEELESPILGVSARRGRYHSTNEANLSHSKSPLVPSTQSSAPFHKLLGKPSTSTVATSQVSTRGVLDSSIALQSNTINSTKSADIAENFATSDYNPLKLRLQRSVSTPSGVVNLSNHNNVVTSASFPTAMPTLHESVSVTSAPLIKSFSVATGLAQLPKKQLHVAASLHGTSAKDNEPASLLSPTSLQLVKPVSDWTAPRSLSGDVITGATTETSSHSLSMPQTCSASVGKRTTLIAPEDFEQSSVVPQKAMQLRQKLLNNDSVVADGKIVLNKKQLATALISLLQSDSSFIDIVHKAYLSGLNSPQTDHSDTILTNATSIWN